MANIMAVNNEKESSMTRVTKEGRRLTYEMVVMQQPERARACGSGAKSSADRRPVDPPPVVMLKILEGDERKDITFSYNANFFLFTTLESARPIAQPRVHSGVPATFPVLTGMPVAGMAYLDRPNAAGYFIFPDLSVRHEGKYRLNFNLYEEVKEPKDEDAEQPRSTTDKANVSPMAPSAHVHFRLEVRSIPFTVYSAKKFPGLAESTHLSRVVADQGCRVRIRRDVRMRRRDPKPGKGYDDYDDDVARSDRYVTPDMYGKSQAPDRPRSVSNGSVHGSVQGSIEVSTPYAVEQRRMSQQDLGYFNQQNYQHPPPPAAVPVQPSNNYTTASHLSFGGSSASQYQVPALPAAQAPAPQPAHTTQTTPSYLPHSNGYSNGYAYQNNAPQRHMSTPQAYSYGQTSTQQQQQQSQYPAPVQQQPQPPQYQQPLGYADNRPEYKPIADYRRASMPLNTQQQYPSQSVNSYTPVDNRPHSMQSYYSSLQQPAPRSMTPQNGHSLPPLSALQPPIDKKYDPVTPTSANPISASSNQSYDIPTSKYGPHASNPQPPAQVPVDSSRSTKRPFGSVFSTSHLNQPMHSGMRPSAADQGRDLPQVEADDGTYQDEYDAMSMGKLLTYRRADGTRQVKKCPSPLSD
ncbi:MAG: hypothetical protein Q9214_001442 [Letrouitia sp. 1 TL-2023]